MQSQHKDELASTPIREIDSQQALERSCRDLYGDVTCQNSAQPLTLREWIDLAEAWRIRQALNECKGNRSAAARALGIGRRTLYSKMERLQIGPAKNGPKLSSAAI